MGNDQGGLDRSKRGKRVAPSSTESTARKLLFRQQTDTPAPPTQRNGRPRLVRAPGDAPLAKQPKRPPAAARPDRHAIGAPISEPTDPRWVLAIRTSEYLEGPILAPEKRETLINMGKAMGLTAFDANLIIAIVQDQARRGYAPEYCPAAGEEQLEMVALPRYSLKATKRPVVIGLIIAGLVLIELVALRIIFG